MKKLNLATRSYIQNQITDLNWKMWKIFQVQWLASNGTLRKSDAIYPQWLIDARARRIKALQFNDLSYIHNK